MLQSYRFVFTAVLLALGQAALAQSIAQPPELPGKPAPRRSKTYEPLDPPSASWRDPASDPMHSILQEMQLMQEQMDAMLQGHFTLFNGLTPTPPAFPFRNQNLFAPQQQRMQQQVEIRDEGRHYVAELQLPGNSGSELDVRVEGGMLTISSSYSTRSGSSTHGHTPRTFTSGSFTQSLSLPGPVQSDRVQVERQKDGRVRIILPKV